ncbi:hypothetical protein IPL68_07875 [Candidatus Saccharibacteria bacterium]|nr:MAG: hypothetical protein IPL68_07875 [Candidatus Saccharibacteria bacterium]
MKPLLIIIIISLVGFTAWFVLNAKSETEDIYSETAIVQTKTAATSKSKSSENIGSEKLMMQNI